MKNPIKLVAILVLASATIATPTFAQLNVPSDGSDGALSITSNTVIDLSQASSGVWTNNNSTNAGNGVFDNTQWAVVFKYSSINIGISNTVTFLNHPTHAPVIWLVQSNVTISGLVNLNGQPFDYSVPQQYTPTEPGPGGFRGGALSPEGSGAGYGPGSDGNTQNSSSATYSGTYGNPQILPLIGGSASGSGQGSAGAGGGGAILIVAGGTVTINGQITANSYSRGGAYDDSWYSSGGGIRIVANQILGNGTIDASEPNPGRTRMEANFLSPLLNIFPNASAVPPGTTPMIFPPATAPTVSIVSVGTQAAPLDPQAEVASSSDIGIQTNSPLSIVLQTQNLPIQGVVTLRITPKYSTTTFLTATYVSGNINQATWQVTTTLPQGFCVLQARATAP